MSRHHILLHARRAAQRGMTLVELMVGLVIGMLLVAGLALMFGNASRTNSEMDKSVRQIENGRYAVDLLTQEIGLAGFYGSVPLTTASVITSPCLTSAALAGELQTMQAASTPTVPHPLRGYIPTDAASLSCLANHKSGTPALVVRRLDATPTAIASLTDGVLYVQTSHNQSDSYVSYKAAVGSGSNSTNFNLKNIAGNANPARRFVSRIYYIATCNDCTGSGDGIPTLKMTELTGGSFTTYALAEGIDQVAFDFGSDTSGDAVPDEWYGLNGSSTATQTTYMTGRWGNVVAVRVSLVSRNTESTNGWVDSTTYSMGLAGTTANTYTPSGAGQAFKRRGHVTTVRLQSWAGLREI